MKFTQDQRNLASITFRDYERRIEMIWDDVLWELSLALNLTEEDTLKLMDEVI